VPTFCRHGRFLERCPICSKTLPGATPAGGSSGAGAKRRSSSSSAGARGGGVARARRGGAHAGSLRVRRQERAVEDGYRSPLLPGVRASADAARLAEELAFSQGRLLALAGTPGAGALPDLYAEVRSLAASGELERASWICLLTVYLCPLEGAEPFVGIRHALGTGPAELPDLSEVPLGPRTSHDPARGTATVQAYRAWYGQSGSQAAAFVGDSGWSPVRRFERLFERLALPGLTRAARYELLVLLGTLGLFELEADSLHLSAARAAGREDATMLAAKRLFAIGDPLLLERRARALAEAIPLPLAALELALANWQADEHASLGFPPETADDETLQVAREALGL
jgi:Alpha-glutamyl/putrescinyl thymine pyrophosphorylase clade 3